MSAESSREFQELDAFVGTWRMETSFAPESGGPRAQTSFEWLEGRRFLVQRWHVEHPDAPDGIAIIGYDDERDTYLQHYFDSRGVARVYEMGIAGGVWTLQRMAPGFSQRFRGAFDASRDTIAGAWELSHDGESWEHDFDLTYRRVAS